MTRRGWLVISLVGAILLISLVCVYFFSYGPGETFLPTASLSSPILTENRTMTTTLVAITKTNVRLNECSIRFMLPNSTELRWKIGSTSWNGDVAQYRNETLGITITYQRNTASSEYFSPGDVIKIQDTVRLDSGLYKIGVFYDHYGNYMAYRTFNVG